MIKKIEVENFGAIKDKVILSFEKGNTKQFEENLIEGTDLLKTIFIYGPNNSGKSTVLKVFKLLNEITTKGRELFTPNGEKLYMPNLYGGSSLNFSTIKIFLTIENKEYVYELQIQFIFKYIIKEIFTVDSIEIFSRNNSDVKINNQNKNIENDIFYISAQYNKEGGNLYIKNIYEYFENIIYIDRQEKNTNQILLGQQEEKILNKFKKNQQEFNKLLNYFDFDFELITHKFNVNLPNDRETFFVKRKNETELPFNHIESFGTQIFVDLLLKVIDTNSQLVVIDEIERGLHFSLVENFIKYFNENFPKKQLLIATHMTDILGINNNIRKDQIYISTMKDFGLNLERGFNKPHIRETMNFQKLYKSDAVGGLPDIKIPEKKNDNQDEK